MNPNWVQSDPDGNYTIDSMDNISYSDCYPIITKNWQELMKKEAVIGQKVYESILFKEIGLSRLFLSTNIEQQSGLFMCMMDTVVGYLDDPSTFDAKLQALGKLHVSRYKIKSRHFKYFKSAFLQAIKLFLPWTDMREKAWHWFWTKIIRAMSQATQSNHLIDKDLSMADVLKRANLVHETFDLAINVYGNEFTKKFYTELINDEPDIGELFENVSTEVQAAKFLSMLKHAISMLDDTQTFENKLAMLGRQHVAYGVVVPQLTQFGKGLIRNVKAFNIRYYDERFANGAGPDDTNTNTNTNTNASANANANANYMSSSEESSPVISGVSATARDTRVSRINAALMLTDVRWAEEHDIAWQWFWKIVVNIFSASMSGKTFDNQNNNANAMSEHNQGTIASLVASKTESIRKQQEQEQQAEQQQDMKQDN